MKRRFYCVTCRQPEYETVCDTCGDNLDMCDIKLMTPPIKLVYDGIECDFCNLKCLSDFINLEFTKEKK